MTFIFGYGSLIWKADFPYKNKYSAYITGYVRRFWHSSNDHRGTIESPGRVVTLISKADWVSVFEKYDPHPAEDFVWGVVYELFDSDVDQVFEYLDYREKNGYVLKKVSAYVKDIKETVECSVYLAPINDECFVGPIKESLEETARVIAKSKGPSGENYEYLFNLMHALQDDCLHLVELRKLVNESRK